MQKIGQLNTRAEVEVFNEDAHALREITGSGCIGTLACVHCYALISDTCLCMGVFKCPECGGDNGKVEGRDTMIMPNLNFSSEIEPERLLRIEERLDAIEGFIRRNKNAMP